MLAELDRLGTISAVAGALRLTAPGVSMQIAALEREVRLKLTERHGRNVSLTPAGRLLAKHGDRIADMLALAEMETAALRDGAAGTYRVAAFPSAARTIVAATWTTILTNPEIGLRLELTEQEPEESLAAITRGEVELAVVHAYSNMPDSSAGLVVTPLATETVWLAVRRGERTELSTEPADLRDFAHRDWVLPHQRWTCHEMVQRACGLAGFEPRAVAEATDFSVVLALVAAGAGVALIPHLAIGRLPDDVVLRPLQRPVYRRDFVVTRPATDADPGIKRLRGLLVDSVDRLSRESTGGIRAANGPDRAARRATQGSVVPG